MCGLLHRWGEFDGDGWERILCENRVKSVCWIIVVVVVVVVVFFFQLFLYFECEWTSLRKLVSRERESLL